MQKSQFWCIFFCISKSPRWTNQHQPYEGHLVYNDQNFRLWWPELFCRFWSLNILRQYSLDWALIRHMPSKNIVLDDVRRWSGFWGWIYSWFDTCRLKISCWMMSEDDQASEDEYNFFCCQNCENERENSILPSELKKNDIILYHIWFILCILV